MKKILLLSLLLTGLYEAAEPAMAAPSVTTKAFPNRLQRTLRRCHRQALARVRQHKRENVKPR